MRFLRQNTAVLVTVGPFYDKADGVTIEGSLTITNERITLTADTDDNSAPTNILDNVTGATSGTSNDLNYITGNDAGMMQLELSAANTNRVGRMMLSITDAANHVPVFHEFFVLPQAIYDWLTGVVTPLPANVTQFGGSNLTSSGGIPEVKVNNIAANAITATAINADAITAAKLAADVTTEIQSGLATAANVSAVETDTQDIQSRLPAALTANGNIKADALRVGGTVQTGGDLSAQIDAVDNFVDTEVGAIKTVVDAIQAKTDNLPSDPADASVVAGLIAGVDAKVDTVDTVVDAIKLKTDNLPTDPADASDIAGAFSTVNTNISTVAGYIDTEVSAIKAVTDKLDDTLEDDGGTFRFTANALEEGPGGGSAPTAADIADAVWEEAIADHSGTAGSTAEALNAAGSAGDPWVTVLPGAYGAGSAGKILGDNLNATVSSRASQASLDTVDGIVDAIVADTNELQTDWANGGRLDNILDARASQTSVDDVPTNAELATALAAADDPVLAAIAALNNLSQANVRTAIGLASANLDTQLDALPTNSEMATAFANADDLTLAAIAALNNLSQAQVETAVGVVLAAYDPPTRAEATGDKDEIITQVNANETKIDAIKAKTDSLTFTTAGEVDANIHSVNDVAVIGTGEPGDTWGPEA